MITYNFHSRDNSLNQAEVDFVQARKRNMLETQAFKKFLRLDENEQVHPDDIPIIGLGGSGGGYRACLGFLACMEEMQNPTDDSSSGLWDLITYVAGVSGSCWSIAGLYAVASMKASILLDRFAISSQNHPLSFNAIDIVAKSANGLYFQLAPILQKVSLIS